MDEITSQFELEAKQRELAALMQQGLGINAMRIKQLEDAIQAYISKKKK